MRADDAYAALAAHLRETAALAQVAGLLAWDQEAAMPPKGAGQRAEQAAALEAVLHQRRSDPRVPEWAAAAGSRSAPAERVNIAEALRMHGRATRVPARLATELARLTTRAHGIWSAARAASCFADFAPTLAEIVALKREEAACLAAPGTDPYDALLDGFEPGMTTAAAAALLGGLRPGLVALRARIAAKAAPVPAVRGEVQAAAQLALAREAATLFGYDWQAGRLDTVVHPFCSGTLGDVRITTRTDPAKPFDSLYSTIHEVGHALYEQGLDPAHAFLPAGEYASMGVHESQSRLCENQIGRSRAFCRWLFPRMRAGFGDFGIGDAEALYRAVNRVEPGFIRTEADEVHYNLHILMRFDLERALISRELEVADLEAAWNARFAADFGVAVPDAARGVLQDVHWSAGLFGYFPTYSLGNIYAGELHAALRQAIPDLDERIEAGEIGPVRTWLGAHIHRQGRLHAPPEIIARAVGHAPTVAPLLSYLEAKFGELYGI
jgi:carboxypeptidase Taq